MPKEYTVKLSEERLDTLKNILERYEEWALNHGYDAYADDANDLLTHVKNETE